MSVHANDQNFSTIAGFSEVNLEQVKRQIADHCYPVGSIYQSTSSTNPATLFGGTWEQMKDRFLLGYGDTWTANKAYVGEANHTLTVSEMPSHTHGYTCGYSGEHTHTATLNNASQYSPYCYTRPASANTKNIPESPTASVETNNKGSHSHTFAWNNNGSGQAHNNMPPYLVVYMWKRIG